MSQLMTKTCEQLERVIDILGLPKINDMPSGEDLIIKSITIGGRLNYTGHRIEITFDQMAEAVDYLRAIDKKGGAQ